MAHKYSVSVTCKDREMMEVAEDDDRFLMKHLAENLSWYAAKQVSEVTILDITADFANGSSGAPVFSEYGAVVGVAKFRQTVGLPRTPQMATKGCLPSSVILNMTKLRPTP